MPISRIRAMVLERFGEPLVMREVPRPALAPGEVLVRITSSGICGSDVHMRKGEDPRTPLPMILGHESVGVAEEVKGDARTVHGRPVKAGDAVAWDRGTYCGRCYFCAVKHEEFICPSRKAYGIHYGGTNPPPLKGGYATHIHLSAATRLFHVPEGVDHDVMVHCACSGATSAHAVEEARLKPGDTAVVIGAGPVGLWAAALANASGAEVIALEPREARRDLALAMGASLALDPVGMKPEEVRAAVLERTHGVGADVVIDATGVKAVARAGLDLVRRGGQYQLPGVAVPVGEFPVRLYEDLAVRNVTVKGIWVSDTGHFARACELAFSRRYPFERVVTHRFPLEEADRALDVAASDPSAVKVVLKP